MADVAAAPDVKDKKAEKPKKEAKGKTEEKGKKEEKGKEVKKAEPAKVWKIEELSELAYTTPIIIEL